MKSTPNKIKQADIDAVIADYKDDRRAVSRHANRLGVTIQAIYGQMRRMGIPRRAGGDSSKGIHAGALNPNWKDGTTKRKDGYILERESGRQIFQHRLVMKRKLGRALAGHEIVHHINGDKSDNRPENLELLPSHAEHMKHHCDREEMKKRGAKGNAARWTSLKARTATIHTGGEEG